ncbi:uncharacterized protein At3g17950 isoform X3 [Capsella rubella]|uniref:uncharacterized protein At3g17950 isoform X3 n=1 Tax=Capsella rubella TaxID=81985 RepID=UPI000CD581AB|nr:uncharacterized protein At3g17950 isoform X3 [Capsella rubella]
MFHLLPPSPPSPPPILILRSITLGTLMGFSFTATMPMPFRASSQRHVSPSVAISRASSSNARRHLRKRPPSSSAEPERHRRRKWWRFCRDDDDDAGIHRGTGDSKRSSLGEYLEVERRFGNEAVYNSAEAEELEGAVARYQEQQPVMGERALFADGRVLPPASAELVNGESTPVATALCRFPVSLTGICSCGGG